MSIEVVEFYVPGVRFSHSFQAEIVRKCVTDPVLGLNESLKGPISNDTKHYIIEYQQYPYHEPKADIHRIPKSNLSPGVRNFMS